MHKTNAERAQERIFSNDITRNSILRLARDVAVVSDRLSSILAGTLTCATTPEELAYIAEDLDRYADDAAGLAAEIAIDEDEETGDDGHG